MFIEEKFNAYSNVFSYLKLLSLIFLFALASESVWDAIRGKRKLLGQTASNISIAIIAALLERTSYGLIFVIGLIIASPLALVTIPFTWWSWLLAFLAADLTYYWMHRCEHRIRILWAHHSVHHSSPEFNFTTALRLSWVEGLIEWLFFVPMIILGFDVVQTIIALLIVVAYQSWIHTEKVQKLGPLELILNTPSAHRVHHGSNQQYLDKNYGGVLIIWDRIFGTYEPEGEKVKYGLTIRFDALNPFTINFHEYGRIIRDIRQAKSWKQACEYLFNHPGWKPKKKTDKG